MKCRFCFGNLEKRAIQKMVDNKLWAEYHMVCKDCGIDDDIPKNSGAIDHANSGVIKRRHTIISKRCYREKAKDPAFRKQQADYQRARWHRTRKKLEEIKKKNREARL